MPLKVKVPAASVNAPVPEMLPAKVSEALLTTSCLLPRRTPPAPARLRIIVPDVVALMSKTPLAVMLEEFSIDPVPSKASDALGLMTVRPL